MEARAARLESGKWAAQVEKVETPERELLPAASEPRRFLEQQEKLFLWTGEPRDGVATRRRKELADAQELEQKDRGEKYSRHR
jgi:hypothetical protein